MLSQEHFVKRSLYLHHFFEAKPHVFISSAHPLATKKTVDWDDLAPYPYLSFEQGEHNPFIMRKNANSRVLRKKNIRVRDRATLFNLLIGLNGYTVCSGVIDENLNGESIIAVPLKEQGLMQNWLYSPQESRAWKAGAGLHRGHRGQVRWPNICPWWLKERWEINE